MSFNGRTKRRYNDPRHPLYAEVTKISYMARGSRVFHHVLNLFALHRLEHRSWSGRVLQTDRYREWIARRDAS